MCFPELDVKSYLLYKAIGPKLINLISLVSTFLLPVAACNTSEFRSNQLSNKEFTLSSLGILIYVLELGVFIVLFYLGLYRI